MTRARYNRIKAALSEANLTAGALAEHMCVHKSTVSDWCTNNNQPSIQDLFKIAKFLGLDHPGDLLVPIKKAWPQKTN
ncbi:helix-turn-helix transcriptional regulator [Dinghuibacter silviterrae]|nr:helix-turn-helix transcriptional regulator [Dinghuibacter silviterrae]